MRIGERSAVCPLGGGCPLPLQRLGRTRENDPVDRFPDPGLGRGEAGLAQKGNGATPPPAFTWRGRRLTTARAHGPERIAPEWWLDDPDWRSGLRDYWRVETAEGPRLWLFYTPADPSAPAWYAHGAFA